ncbi:MAG: DUF4013 domain-containing protein, partial [Candidatus Promineifilaceae bacterium]|nr:DUF4013 domain-containing protein [Candidatus Promineifilaceae bacterium]
MDIGRAVTFAFEDEEWPVKLGIAVLMTLLLFLILPIFLLGGWVVAIARNVAQGELRPLAGWSDWERLLRDGFFVFVGQFVYTLPLWIILCAAIAAAVGFGSVGSLGEEAAAIGSAGVVGVWGVLGCLFLVALVFLFFITPAVIIQYVRTDDLGALFRVGEVVGIARDNLGEIVIVVAVTFGLSLLFSVVTSIVGFIPCLGQIVAFILGL